MNHPAPDLTVPYDHFFSLWPQVAHRHGMSIFSLPVAVQPYEYLKNEYSTRYPNGQVLDFGCGSQKPLQQAIGITDALYHSCDTDTSGEFTYNSLDEIPSSALYDIIAANQVFEHLTFEDGLNTACRLATHLAPDGIFQIGVPNPQHPTRHLANPTHKTPWNYLSLCSLLELSGLDAFYCARCNKYPGPRWFEWPLISMIGRVYRMDWCDTIYAVGRRLVKE